MKVIASGGVCFARPNFARMHRFVLTTSVLVLSVMLLSGCVSPPQVRTTFLNSIDLIAMTDQMAESFVQDERVAERSTDDDRWVISIDRIANQTNQIIRDSEKWLYVERMRGLLAQTDVGEKRNIIWVYPPDQWRRIAEEVGGPEPPGLRLTPTHRLTGTFGALTVTGPRGRSDTYVCSYELFDLETGAIVWEDLFEVKRAVAGRTWD